MGKGKKSEHIKAEIGKLHPKEGPGCVWGGHETGFGDYRSMECHYRKNGFQKTEGNKQRLGMYNKEQHRQNAVEAGYAQWADDDHKKLVRAGQLFEQELKGAEGKREGKPLANFRRKFRKKYRDPISWLELDEKGWHYGFDNTARPFHGKVAPAFKPYDDDDHQSLGANFPYAHHYHHMIATAEFDKWVITQEDRDERIKKLLATKWNINGGRNIVCLPSELWTSAIVELPAHCPWGERKHPEYSSTLKAKLEELGSQLTDAIGDKKDCEQKLEDIATELNALSDRLLKSIIDLAPAIEQKRRSAPKGTPGAQGLKLGEKP